MLERQTAIEFQAQNLFWDRLRQNRKEEAKTFCSRVDFKSLSSLKLYTKISFWLPVAF